MELLEEVGRLQSSLSVIGDMSHTCETAGYFYLYQVWLLTEVVNKILHAYHSAIKKNPGENIGLHCLQSYEIHLALK